MKLYGLTGGIGSGKSEAARRFRERGIPVIDADKIGHEVIAPGGAVEAEVKAAFGDAILTGGKIDREKLGRVAFNDAAARRTLNQLVHPVIIGEVARHCAGLSQQGHDIALVEAALLSEHGQREPWLTGLILIICGEPERIRRLGLQRSLRPEEAQARMAAQRDPGEKVALADWVIENDGSLEHLYAQVDGVAEVLHGKAGGS
ncbi:MAG: dephospho-CoA kinase [Candidatus Hydrogenedentes bacterium]|nr:dephospho-CoA kinase [Candidatus Hydrogenedentota bacterium]